MQTARGGAKPKMMVGSSDLYVTVNGQRKFGIYELCGDTLGRRVEMPGWLSDIWTSAGGNLLRLVIGASYPTGDVGESRGHIFMRPPPALFSCPAVGLDLEIHHTIVDRPGIKRVRFYVYATNHKLAGVWEISADRFVESSKLVTTKKSFMPQMMVPLTEFAT